MSRTYKTGDMLKGKMLNTAGRFFEQYGYDKTTFQMIADELNVSKAAIAYHFKTKPWIIYRLLEKYIRSTYAYINENTDKSVDYFTHLCIHQAIVYKSVFEHERNRVLFFHKDHAAIWENERQYMVEDFFREISNEFRKELCESEIRALAVMNIGAKLGIIKRFLQAPDKFNVTEQCRYMMNMVGSLAKLDEATVTRCVNFAFAFTESHDPPKLILA